MKQTMDREAFKKRVEQKLKPLDREQRIQFAWLCAIRALPFLGHQGNFNFWEPEDRQKYLYAILNALDHVAADASSDAYASDDAYDAAFAAAYAEADAAYDAAYDASSDAAYAYDAAASDAAYAAASDAAYAYDAAASDAAYAAAAASDAATASDAASDAASAASSAYAAASAAAFDIDLQPILLQDIQVIRRKEKWSVSLKMYGEYWQHFQQALKAEDCAYWGKLYQKIFENQLVLDPISLERRLQVPTEIQEQGAGAVGHYLEELEAKGSEQLNEARVIILGEKGAGKTCLARKLIDPNAEMTTADESTAGVDTLFWELKQWKIQARIWDFAGHTVTHAVHQFFLSERCIYIIVYDGRSEHRNRLDYWLNHMKNYGGKSKAMILVNQRDQHAVKVPINKLKEQYAIHSHHSFSIQNDPKALKQFRVQVAHAIRDNLSWNQQVIPKNYFQVKAELEQLFIKGNAAGKEHISREDFETIAKKHQVDDTERLLEDLHALGVSLWYREMTQFNTLILNPEWISQGVYQIINTVSNAKKNGLSLKNFAVVFKRNAERYPECHHAFLFEMMKHFELAYEVEHKQSLIIPHLLPEDQPSHLPSFPVGESLELRYIADQPLPPDTISRFIVRHHRTIKKEPKRSGVWRSGVVLEDGKGSLALVREVDRTIRVSVKGADRSNYIDELRKTLNAIFGRYKSKKPELEYRIERFGTISKNSEEANAVWLPEQTIHNHMQNQKPYYDHVTNQYIDLSQTVNHYHIQSVGQWMTGGSNNRMQIDDHSIHFNFHDCKIDMQANLNDLAISLKEAGSAEEAKELETAAKALKQVEGGKPNEVKASGIQKRLERLVHELADEKSTLHRSIKGIKSGIGIAQDLGKAYNDIAQWMGLPQVPQPFLKK